MPGQAGTLSEAANRVFIVWALVWWGGTAKQADRQGGRREWRVVGRGTWSLKANEGFLSQAHTVSQPNKSLPSSEDRDMVRVGERRQSSCLLINSKFWKEREKGSTKSAA